MAMDLDRAEIRRVLEGTNPWWTGRSEPVPPFKRLAFYKCHKLLLDRTRPRAIALTGPRRVGKSVILKQVASELLGSGVDPRSVLYASFEHSLLKLVPLSRVLEVYRESFHPFGKPAFLLLDEIHYSPQWDTEVKYLVDQHPEYRILATGSAITATHGERESGVGRWETVKIPTLSFFEYLRLRDIEVGVNTTELALSSVRRASDGDRTILCGKLRHLLPEFERYMLVGGFPETAKMPSIGDAQRLLHDDVVDRVLKRDMTSLFGVRSVPELERLFIYLCYHSGGIVKVQKCASELEINRQTVQNYLDLLEQANLLYRLLPDGRGGKLALKGSSKYYLVDAAIRNAVLIKGEEVLRDPTELGKIAETTVLRHAYAYHYSVPTRLAYWRDSATNLEIDIIVRLKGVTIPIEVKYRTNTLKDSLRPLHAFCGENLDVTRAYIVTRDENDFGPLEEKIANATIYRIPAHIMCLSLGSSEHDAK